MERLLSLLPPAQPVIVRYGLTTLFVLVCWLLEIGVQAQSGMIGLFLLMPAIFLASIIFDRGSGFYATILRHGLVDYRASSNRRLDA
jgi:two-component system, sensor histidine kinase PdtaS